MNKLLLMGSAAVERVKQNSTGRLLNWASLLLGVCLFPAAVPVSPVLAAERIYLSYEILERSISVDALETYARQGKIEDDLATYAQYVNEQQMAQLRQILQRRLDLSPIAVSQFLYTTQGEYLLQRFGQVIQTESRQPGSRALRSALIMSAASPEGLTLLNVLRKFPTSGIRIDLARSLQMADELSKIINQTNQAIATIAQQSVAKAAQAPLVSLPRLIEIHQPGPFTPQKLKLQLNDPSRDRQYTADIYLPTSSNLSSLPNSVPVIALSHGLGGDLTIFAYLAQHLASHGFAVAVPEHPGSSAQQLQDLFSGRASQAAKPTEFIDRPLDVKYLLDQLERLSKTDPVFQSLNLQQVGVIGQSFGGYTALALAGASLNFDQLRQDCQALDKSWNLSLLLQCEALKLAPAGTALPDAYQNLRDERVKAAIAINPITSSIFGQQGMNQIKIPVMIVAGSADTVAPVLAEQIQPFTWLTTPDKYLVVMENATHFSALGEEENTNIVVPFPTSVIGPEPSLARRYVKGLSLAFFETYVNEQAEYRPYLSAAYAKTISQEPIGLRLVQSLVNLANIGS